MFSMIAKSRRWRVDSADARRVQTVYLDSTILSFLHDRRPLLAFQSQTTRRWWRDERGRFRLFLSEATLNELSEGNYPMRADPILREKWRVQRELARKAGNDPVRYLDLVHENVERWAKANGIQLKYADVSELPVGTLRVKETPAGYKTKRAKRVRKSACPATS